MKNVLKLLTALLFSAVMGSLFALVLDVSALITFSILFSLGFLPMSTRGVLLFNFASLEWVDGSENMGGLQVIGYFAPIADIDNFPTLPENPATPADEVTLMASPGFTLLANKFFRKLYSTMETSSVDDENQGEVDGQSFVHKATVFHPGTKAEALAFAKGVNNSSMVFIFVESTGQRRVIGSKAFPAKCKPSFTTGKATADRKGMSLEITSYGYTPAPIYNGPIPLEGEVVT